MTNDSKTLTGSKKKDYKDDEDLMNNSMPQDDQKRIPTFEEDPMRNDQQINIDMCDQDLADIQVTREI